MNVTLTTTEVGRVRAGIGRLGSGARAVYQCTPPNGCPIDESPAAPEAAELRCTPVKMEAAVKGSIASFQSRLEDWRMEELNLGQLASNIRGWIDYWSRLICDGHKGRPLFHPCFIGFERRPFVTLGCYKAGRNPNGLTRELSVNPANFNRFSEKQVAAVVVHFVLHCFLEQTGGCGCNHHYHSSHFRSLAGTLGIPAGPRGCSCEIRNDPASPFMTWARASGLGDTPLIRSGGKKRPKRMPWTCQCGVVGYFASGVKVDLFCGNCHTRMSPKTRKEAALLTDAAGRATVVEERPQI